MNPDHLHLYDISEEKEKQLFKSSYIFFDTSALLAFYFFSDITIDEIFNKGLNVFKNRLWIAEHTEYEFLKNRETVAKKPLQSYDELLKANTHTKQGGHVEEMGKLIANIKSLATKDIRGQLKTLVEKTAKNDKHPFLEPEIFLAFDKNIDEIITSFAGFETQFAEFKKSLEERIQSQITSLSKDADADPVFEKLKSFFSTTEGFTYTELKSLVDDGEWRYKNQIPPGYLDYKDKTGFQKYGDLILWKQIVRKCQQDKKSAILVTNDLKEDWWQSNKEAPRYELIKEITDTNPGIQFWMYDLKNFLLKSRKYLSTQLEENVITEATSASLQNSVNDEIVPSSSSDIIERNIIRSSYAVIAYRSREVLSNYVSRLRLNAQTKIEGDEIRPILLPPLLKTVFKDLKIGELIFFSRNFLYNEYGHFAGFRKNDLGITVHPSIRKVIGIRKGLRYTVEIDVKERRINFSEPLHQHPLCSPHPPPTSLSLPKACCCPARSKR